MRTDIVAGAVFPDYELTDHTGTRRMSSFSNLASLYSRSTTVTGFSADRPSKSFAKTCVLY
jgi:hypothetical protein